MKITQIQVNKMQLIFIFSTDAKQCFGQNRSRKYTFSNLKCKNETLINIKQREVRPNLTANKYRLSNNIRFSYTQKWNLRTSFSLYSFWFSRLVCNIPQNRFLQLKSATLAAERWFASPEQTTTHIAVLANAACCWVSLEYKQSAGGGKSERFDSSISPGAPKRRGFLQENPCSIRMEKGSVTLEACNTHTGVVYKLWIIFHVYD